MTASKFRMYIDKGTSHIPATREDIVEGAVFIKDLIEYTVDKVDGESVYMTGYNGAAIRSTIVDISEVIKLGSLYIFKKG